MTRRDETFECPNCGAELPMDAIVCPECGSDDETGWSPDSAYDGLDLPMDEDEEEAERRPGMAVIWKFVAWLLLGLIAFSLIATVW